jgi:hypothetical protein
MLKTHVLGKSSEAKDCSQKRKRTQVVLGHCHDREEHIYHTYRLFSLWYTIFMLGAFFLM